MVYRRAGRSGLKLPAISLGLWQNFGSERPLDASREIVLRAFDLGVTHFDLANNYGPPYGAAEETFGRILRSDLGRYRDELIVSTKAGWDMWPGRGRCDRARAASAARHPPAVVQHLRPLDRDGRAARRLRTGRHRLHRVLTPGAGAAVGPVAARHPRGIARDAQPLFPRRGRHRGEARAGTGAERDSRAAGPEPRSDGA